MPANSNTTITLELTGITGGSQAGAGGKSVLDIMSWGWGASNPTTRNTAKGLSSGTPTISELSFTKIVCKASPIVMQYLANGKHFATGTLTMSKTTGEKTPQVFYTVELDKVFITHYSSGADASTVDTTESFTVAYEKINVKYKPQNTDTGALEAEVLFGYDTKTMTTT